MIIVSYVIVDFADCVFFAFDFFVEIFSLSDALVVFILYAIRKDDVEFRELASSLTDDTKIDVRLNTVRRELFASCLELGVKG